MTAINIVRQPRHKCVHVLTDGAFYLLDGTVLGFGSKTFTVPSWPGSISTRGSALATAIVCAELTIKFSTWDAMVLGIEAALPAAAELCDLVNKSGQDTFEVALAGWSAKRRCPESYLIRAGDEHYINPDEFDAAIAAGGIAPDGFVLTELPVVATAPPSNEEFKREIGFDGIDRDDPPAKVISDMLLIMEGQRQERHAVHGLPEYAVGGFAQLTTITPEGIDQKVLKRWAEDDGRLGQCLAPSPVDWVAWRARHGYAPQSAPVVDLAGMTRVQRDMANRKAAKAARRGGR